MRTEILITLVAMFVFVGMVVAQVTLKASDSKITLSKEYSDALKTRYSDLNITSSKITCVDGICSCYLKGEFIQQTLVMNQTKCLEKDKDKNCLSYGTKTESDLIAERDARIKNIIENLASDIVEDNKAKSSNDVAGAGVVTIQ